MKSALRKLYQRLARHIPCKMIDSASCGQHRGFTRREGQTYQARSRHCERRSAVRRDPDNAALAAERSGHVQIALAIKRHTLRAPQAAVVSRDRAMRIDLVHRIKARSSRSCHEQITCGTDREMISRNTWFDSCEHKNLPVAGDFENCAATVTDV